jgi:hypothetical protein
MIIDAHSDKLGGGNATKCPLFLFSLMDNRICSTCQSFGKIRIQT